MKILHKCKICGNKSENEEEIKKCEQGPPKKMFKFMLGDDIQWFNILSRKFEHGEIDRSWIASYTHKPTYFIIVSGSDFGCLDRVTMEENELSRFRRSPLKLS